MPSLIGNKPNQVPSNGDLGTLAFQDASNVLVGNINATGVTTVQAGTASAPAITTTGDTNTGIFFPAADTIAFAEGGAEVARFDSSGNLGIGVTNPSFSGFSSDSNGIVVKSANTYGLIKLGGATGEFYVGSGSSSAAWLWNQSNSPIVFATNGADRGRIDASGNLLVGTTSSIDVASGSTDGATIYPSSLQISRNDGTPLLMRRRTSNGEMVAFRRDTTFVGSISVTTTATAYNTSSDYRLKDNIQPLQNALGVVAQLKPVTYKWKSDGSDGQGFIAHELQEVVPDSVTGEKDAVDAEGNPVYQGIDVSFLVATLTAAIKEQQAIITDLKSRIETLESTQG
jgi:hypothetical protein